MTDEPGSFDEMIIGQAETPKYAEKTCSNAFIHHKIHMT
jgi:hypothetical protein